MDISDNISKMMGLENKAKKLYQELNTDKFKEYPYEMSDLGEGMTVVNEVMWGYWKPRFLINHNTKCAYEFINSMQDLVTVTEDDIDWESLKDLPEDAQRTAKALSFHFPSFILGFKNGVAEVSWQLNPDGRYYMDEDGYGMTDDEEVEIYGFIDQNANVVVKFRHIKKWSELDGMRTKAEGIVRQEKR